MSERKKILIVDDNPANLTTCKAILKDKYDVFTALSAESMFSLMGEVKPDLIVLDIRMPGMDGYEAARILKKTDAYKNIPLIFMTALNDVEREMEGLDMGAVDYVNKPYFPPVFLKRIEIHLDLVDKTRRLEMASQAKSEFLTGMSHELRSPLTTVLGLTELMLSTEELSGDVHANLAKIHRAGETLLGIINDILDISKIEAGRFIITPVEYDVASMLDDTVAQSVYYKDSDSVEFVLDICSNLPSALFGDVLRVKQVLNNLLSNAFKYTLKGTIEMGVRYEEGSDGEIGSLNAWVRDTGIGIKDELIENLFGMYFLTGEGRPHTDAGRRTESSGLGLCITKSIVEEMGGEILVESEYGKGSCFTVKIPQKRIGTGVIGENTAKNLKNLSFYVDEFEGAEKLPHINMSYAKVLIVDDNVINAEVAKAMMSFYGINADCVHSARHAIDSVHSGKIKYDAIFMDYMMPDTNGIEALRYIREIGSEYAKNVPIIALTANAIIGSEEMFLEKGFNAYISKPIELSRLDSILRMFVRNEEKEALLDSKTIEIGKINKDA